MNTFWIEEVLWAQITADAALLHPLETGGMLVGYCAEGDVVVTDLISAGPGAVHLPMNFEHDTPWQITKLNEIWDKYEGVRTYLGDWHSHPEGPSIPSPLDLQTLKLVQTDTAAQCPSPIMLIKGLGTTVYRQVEERVEVMKLVLFKAPEAA